MKLGGHYTTGRSPRTVHEDGARAVIHLGEGDVVYSSAAIEQQIACPCGQYHWREVIAVAAIGVVAFERKCRRCSHWYLIVVRVSVGIRPSARVVAKIRKRGRGEADLRLALQQVPDLTPDEVAFLLEVARSLSAGEKARAMT